MAKKNNNNGVENKNKNNDTNNNDGGEKKEDGSIASKIVKWVKPFQGVTWTGCKSVRADAIKHLLRVTATGLMDVPEMVSSLMEKLTRHAEIEPPNKNNGGNDGNDGEGGGGGGGGVGDEKKKEEDEGNDGGKMKYPAGQSGFGRFSYGTVYRHGYGYQNGALKTPEKLLLLRYVFYGLLVMYYFYLAKEIYTNVTLLTHRLLYI